VRALLL